MGVPSWAARSIPVWKCFSFLFKGFFLRPKPEVKLAFFFSKGKLCFFQRSSGAILVAVTAAPAPRAAVVVAASSEEAGASVFCSALVSPLLLTSAFNCWSSAAVLAFSSCSFFSWR